MTQRRNLAGLAVVPQLLTFASLMLHRMVPWFSVRVLQPLDVALNSPPGRSEQLRPALPVRKHGQDDS